MVGQDSVSRGQCKSYQEDLRAEFDSEMTHAKELYAFQIEAQATAFRDALGRLGDNMVTKDAARDQIDTAKQQIREELAAEAEVSMWRKFIPNPASAIALLTLLVGGIGYYFNHAHSHSSHVKEDLQRYEAFLQHAGAERETYLTQEEFKLYLCKTHRICD